jgi:hypothetical protein
MGCCWNALGARLVRELGVITGVELGWVAPGEF